MIVAMDKDTRLRRIQEAREAADAARDAMMRQVKAALGEGIRPSAIAHAARWSDTYVRSIARKQVRDD